MGTQPTLFSLLLTFFQAKPKVPPAIVKSMILTFFSSPSLSSGGHHKLMSFLSSLTFNNIITRLLYDEQPLCFRCGRYLAFVELIFSARICSSRGQMLASMSRSSIDIETIEFNSSAFLGKC